MKMLLLTECLIVCMYTYPTPSQRIFQNECARGEYVWDVFEFWRNLQNFCTYILCGTAGAIVKIYGLLAVSHD